MSARVRIQNNINGCSVVRIDAPLIVKSLFQEIALAGDLEPFEARSLSARLETLAGELTRAAGNVENQRIAFHGGPVPAVEMATEPTEPGPVQAAPEVVPTKRSKPRKGFATLHVHKPGEQCNLQCREVPYGTLPGGTDAGETEVFKPRARHACTTTYGSPNGAPPLPAVRDGSGESLLASMAQRQTVAAFDSKPGAR